MSTFAYGSRARGFHVVLVDTFGNTVSASNVSLGNQCTPDSTRYEDCVQQISLLKPACLNFTVLVFDWEEDGSADYANPVYSMQFSVDSQPQLRTTTVSTTKSSQHQLVTTTVGSTNEVQVTNITDTVLVNALVASECITYRMHMYE